LIYGDNSPLASLNSSAMAFILAGYWGEKFWPKAGVAAGSKLTAKKTNKANFVNIPFFFFKKKLSIDKNRKLES